MSDPLPADLTTEVELRRTMYALRDKDPAIQAMWGPFSELEVAHRCQQYFALAGMFRRLGWTSLTGLKILDVGCGQGRMLRACLDLGASPEDLTGVDVRAGAIEEARRLSPQIDFRVGNGIDLELADGTFDLVMQFVVFSSVYSAHLHRHLAREMIRVLKPGGYLFWWDMPRTVQKESPEPLKPQELFAGMPCFEVRSAMRPRPSYCVRLPRWLKWSGRLLDVFGYPDSHVAALVGPKRLP